MSATAEEAGASSISRQGSYPYPAPLQFQSLSSAVDVSFWAELGRLKLDVLQLSSAPLPLTAAFTTSPHAQLPAQLLLGAYSFDAASASLPSYHALYRGTLHNANTIDEFTSFDTNSLCGTVRDALWADLLRAASPPSHADSSVSPATSASFAEPSVNRFLLLTYADLKSHKYARLGVSHVPS